jgi:carbon-monoxide dehydrogenase small subunit
MKLKLRINGRKYKLDVPPMKRLLDTLREDLGLTGTKEGCGEGECGACTVSLDGEVVNSCLVAAGQCDGRKVTTVEGLAHGDVLRGDLRLTGTKEGCGEGECGACTVLLDGEPVNSCLIPVCQVEGRRIETVESLGDPARLGPLQESFMEHGGAQCGICTPGMLMTATAWIKDGGSDKPRAIRECLSGNLCRCTGYQHIVDSVAHAVRRRRK